MWKVSFAAEEHAREVEVSAGECPLKDLFPAVYRIVRVRMYHRQEDAEQNLQPSQLYYALLAERLQVLRFPKGSATRPDSCFSNPPCCRPPI